MHAHNIGRRLKSCGTCCCLTEDDTHARELFRAIREVVPICAVVSRTGKTLHVGIVTEDPRSLGHNDRINLRTHMDLVRKVQANEPERVLR